MSRGQREQVFERVRDAILDFRLAPRASGSSSVS